MKKNRKASNPVAAVAIEDQTETVCITAEAIVTPVANDEIAAAKALLDKARIARLAAEKGLIPQDEADALWEAAVAACKPSEESIRAAKDAKAKAAEAAKVLRIAKDAFAQGMVSAELLNEKEAEAEMAKAMSTEAARAAKGIGLGGGGTRYKGQMSGKEAAHKILSESPVPLNAKTIADKAIELGYWSPDGVTPAMTMSAVLQAEAKKANGLFVKVGPGLYGLRSAA